MNEDLSLWGISEELKELDEMCEAADGEIDAEWEQKKEKFMELLTKKVDGCVGFIQKKEDINSIAREHQKRLADFIKTNERKIETFKEYIKKCMALTGRTEFEGVLCKIDTIKGRESLQIDVDAIDKLPIDFLKTEVYPKKDELKTAIKNGLTIPGVRLVRSEPSIRFGLKKESRKRKEQNANEQSDAATTAV